MTTTRYNTRTVRDAMARMNNGMSSFDETSVSIPSTLFDLKSVYPVSRLRDAITTTGTGSVTQANGRFEVSVGADGGDSAEFRSVERARYVAGYDGVPGLAINLNKMPTGNQVVEWGNTDFQNGFVVGADAEGMFTRLYSGGAVVATKRQEAWEYGRNVTIDPTNVTIYRTPYRWYAAGPYRLDVDWIDDNGYPTILPLDRFESTDHTLPITEDPNQPITVRVKNNGTAETLTAYVMGRQYIIHGDYKPNRRVIGEFRLSQTVNNTFVPLVAARQKGGIYRSISTKLAGVGILSDKNLIWEIRALSSITGGTWIDPRFTDNGQESAMEFNTSATAVNGTGIQVYVGGPIPAGGGNVSGAEIIDLPDLDIPSNIEDDPIVVCARTIGTQDALVSTTLRIREEW